MTAGLFSWLDAHPVWAEWALVVVGIGTLIVIACQTIQTKRAAQATLKSAESIEKQTRLLERSVEASEKTADAAKQSIETMINKERARIRVEPGKLKLEAGPLAISEIQYSLFCYGTTPAFIEDSWANLEVTNSERASSDNRHVPMSLGKVLSPNPDGVTKNAILFFRPEGDFIGQINTRRAFLHFYGMITYKDVFGNSQETKFRYLWRVTQLEHGLGSGTPFAFWMKCCAPEDNHET